MWRSPLGSEGTTISEYSTTSTTDAPGGGAGGGGSVPYSVQDLQLPAIRHHPHQYGGAGGGGGGAVVVEHTAPPVEPATKQPYRSVTNAQKVSVAQIRKHEQSLHASRRRINDDLRQLMVTYRQQRAEVVRELQYMRRELQQIRQQQHQQQPQQQQQPTTKTGSKSTSNRTDSSDNSDDMHYIKSPYRYDKGRGKKLSGVGDGFTTKRSRAHQMHQKVPPLVADTGLTTYKPPHRTDNRLLEQKGDNMVHHQRMRHNKLPALNEEQSPRSKQQQNGNKLRDKTSSGEDGVSVQKGNVESAVELLERITNRRSTVTYHLPALDPSAEQRVIYNKPEHNSKTWKKRKHRKYNPRTGHVIHANVLPPLIESTAPDTIAEGDDGNAAGTHHNIREQTVPDVVPDSESLPTGTHVSGKSMTTDTSNKPTHTAASEPVESSPPVHPTSIRKSNVPRKSPNNSDSSGSETEKKNVRFAPDVIDYNRESKPSYRRHPGNTMRVMELVVHCHNAEDKQNNRKPLDELPNVVEKYMLRSVPKINS